MFVFFEFIYLFYQEEEAAKANHETNVWKLEEELEALKTEIDKEKKAKQTAEKAKKLLEGQVTGLNEQLEEATKNKTKLNEILRQFQIS